VLFWYTLLAIPFLFYHEKHLPLPIILSLLTLAILVSILLAFVSFYILGWIFAWDYFWVTELFYFGISLVILFFLGILENRGGRVFLFFIFLLFLLFRQIKSKVYYRSILFGVAILINGLLTFQSIALGEEYLFHSMFKDKYETSTEDFSKWNFNETTRILQNTSIPLEMKIPVGLFFHSPDSLSLKNKTGSGQIAGILSSSERDPNIYPYIRIFIISGYMAIDAGVVKTEYEQVLDFESQRGEIETIQFIDQHHPELHPNWEGFFWSFFDTMRPRYSKSGFYLIGIKNGKHIVLDIRENKTEINFHEDVIQTTIDSIK
jgi:hypothetical protein